jgi:pyruvate kinase
MFTPRRRKVRIVATLGPASSTAEMIKKLFEAGADVFRINMSHGSQADKAELIKTIRAVEAEENRPIPILADLQGPKLRVGRFADGPVTVSTGGTFQFDLDPTPGDATRVQLPHKEVFAALRPGATLLVDDGKLRFVVEEIAGETITTRIIVGGTLSNNKGLNVPDVVIPLAALTEKDHADLAFALEHGVDWIALSFVQRPEDVAEARKLVGNRAGVLAKIEKPSAVERIDEIIDLADAIMVARGDLGVELPPEQVPAIQKRIIAAARAKGKPVVVATQMLESMIVTPTPTRAEVSDVANAVYDGGPVAGGSCGNDGQDCHQCGERPGLWPPDPSFKNGAGGHLRRCHFRCCSAGRADPWLPTDHMFYLLRCHCPARRPRAPQHADHGADAASGYGPAARPYLGPARHPHQGCGKF